MAKKAAEDLAAAIAAAILEGADFKDKADIATNIVGEAVDKVAELVTEAGKAVLEAQETAEEAADKVPIVATPPTNPNATPV